MKWISRPYRVRSTCHYPNSSVRLLDAIVVTRPQKGGGSGFRQWSNPPGKERRVSLREAFNGPVKRDAETTGSTAAQPHMKLHSPGYRAGTHFSRNTKSYFDPLHVESKLQELVTEGDYTRQPEMATYDDYTVACICALPAEVAAVKAVLDLIHPDLPRNPAVKDTNAYVLGSLFGHNVVLAYPAFGVSGTVSVASVAMQLRASFKSIRFSLIVATGGGVPGTKEDIRLGDIVVSTPTAGRPGLVHHQHSGKATVDQPFSGDLLDQPSALLLTAVGKTETGAIFGESRIPLYLSQIVQTDPAVFAHPGPEQDILFDSKHEHAGVESGENGGHRGTLDGFRHRQPRDSSDPVVHYGGLASMNQLMGHEASLETSVYELGGLSFEEETAGLVDAAQCLQIRGICDYGDSHNSKLWRAYAAAAAAAYVKELLSFIPIAPKQIPLAEDTYAMAAPVLDALLLTRPEVDRTSLIVLKGRRVDGTCEWLAQNPQYREWLVDDKSSLFWISGGPGKGKTMLAIYITDILQPPPAAVDDVLLYYFCSNRDKNRNTAVTIMRGILHQWLNGHRHLARHIKNSFKGTETTKYTISNFTTLWRTFLTLLQQSGSRQVVCVLDGLDECEKESLGQLLDAVRSYLSNADGKCRPRLKFIFLSRPQPALLENKLNQYRRIKLDDSDKEIANDVERYIFAKVDELASEQEFSEDMVLHVRQALLAGAEGTFLWVGFVANELKGRSWEKMSEILHGVPKGLGGIYRKLLQQIEEKEQLVPILQWIVLAARPLTIDELTVAAEVKPSSGLPPVQVTKNLLASCGLLVKIESDVVNLVHESAKDFFQSDQVDFEGINMFYMSRETHWILMRHCLTVVEQSYGSLGGVDEKSARNSLFGYASLHWPMHFKLAIEVLDAMPELPHQFFRLHSPVRDEWWRFYWEQEKNGGEPPAFTLLHLAAYLGNLVWAQALLDKHARLLSRKDNYGRTSLSWAVKKGHRDMVQLLLDHGAQINAKDRSGLTALHIAVAGENRDIVALLLDSDASVEAKATSGDTPLVLAIQAYSKEIVELLLTHEARVDGLPLPSGIACLKGPTEPMEERVQELLGLQEQLLSERYKLSSKKSDLIMKLLGLSFRIPVIIQLMTVYLKHMALGRWDRFSLLQDLVKENRINELRTWMQTYRKFYIQLVVARNPSSLAAMADLPTLVFQAVSTEDLQALLVMGVLVGSEAKLAAVRHEWREGDAILGRAFAKWASIAYRRDAEESLHYGVREFLADYDVCIRSGGKEDNVARAVVLLTSQCTMLENQDPRPIEYFSTVVAEFYEGYIGGRYEHSLFNDANQACAYELAAISENRDSSSLLLLLRSILQFAHRSREKGQDRFLGMPAASCLILCQKNSNAHRWLIAEAIPETMSALVSQQQQGQLQTRACRGFVECLIVGKRYGLVLPAALRRRVKEQLGSLIGVDVMLDQILDS